MIKNIFEYLKTDTRVFQSIKESLKTFELDTLKNNLNKFISETQEYKILKFLEKYFSLI